ncbi:hypothetical protein [Thaumasiovibrio sp. DFM-14]|uniref:hypothetical protein n=1 Tax=Thaumasiovibrio sp. DFM-14 TaxID=3384792 RepID=UPI0039A09E1C
MRVVLYATSLLLVGFVANAEVIRHHVYDSLSQAHEEMRRERYTQAISILESTHTVSSPELANVERLKAYSYAQLSRFNDAARSCHIALEEKQFVGEYLLDLMSDCQGWENAATISSDTVSDTVSDTADVEPTLAVIAKPTRVDPAQLAIQKKIESYQQQGRYQDEALARIEWSRISTEPEAQDFAKIASLFAQENNMDQANFWLGYGLNQGHIKANSQHLSQWAKYAVADSDWATVKDVAVRLRDEEDNEQWLSLHLLSLYHLKDWVTLQSLSQHATTRFPYLSANWRYLGISSYYLTEYAQAEFAFTRLAELNPGSDAHGWLLIIRRQK